MRRNWRDFAATVLVAAVVVAYLGYLVRGSMPFIEDARGMAAVGLLLGWSSHVVGGRGVFDPGTPRRFATAAGFGSLALGAAALATENSVALAMFIASIVMLWAVATLAHVRPGGLSRHLNGLQ